MKTQRTLLEYPFRTQHPAENCRSDPRKTSGTPRSGPTRKSVELLVVAPPENEVDEYVVPPLMPSYYDSDDEYDDGDEDKYMSTQQHQRVIHP